MVTVEFRPLVYEYFWLEIMILAICLLYKWSDNQRLQSYYHSSYNVFKVIKGKISNSPNFVTVDFKNTFNRIEIVKNDNSNQKNSINTVWKWSVTKL